MDNIITPGQTPQTPQNAGTTQNTAPISNPSTPSVNSAANPNAPTTSSSRGGASSQSNPATTNPSTTSGADQIPNVNIASRQKLRRSKRYIVFAVVAIIIAILGIIILNFMNQRTVNISDKADAPPMADQDQLKICQQRGACKYGQCAIQGYENGKPVWVYCTTACTYVIDTSGKCTNDSGEVKTDVITPTPKTVGGSVTGQCSCESYSGCGYNCDFKINGTVPEGTFAYCTDRNTISFVSFRDRPECYGNCEAACLKSNANPCPEGYKPANRGLLGPGTSEQDLCPNGGKLFSYTEECLVCNNPVGCSVCCEPIVPTTAPPQSNTPTPTPTPSTPTTTTPTPTVTPPETGILGISTFWIGLLLAFLMFSPANWIKQIKIRIR